MRIYIFRLANCRIVRLGGNGLGVGFGDLGNYNISSSQRFF